MIFAFKDILKLFRKSPKKIRYNYLSDISVNALSKPPVLFGLAQGAFIPVIGSTRKGKSSCVLHCVQEYFMLGESYVSPDGKLVGPPPNLSNLKDILSAIKGVAAIDSLSGIHVGAERLQKSGLDLSIFDLISELDYLCSETPMVVFGIYNPYKAELEKDVQAELEGRTRLMVRVESGYKASVLIPTSRTWSQPMEFQDVWPFMLGAATSVKRKTHPNSMI